MKNRYPTIDQVNNASHYQICAWNRFLPSPENGVQVAIIDRIVDRLKQLGGFTPAISKALGWDLS